MCLPQIARCGFQQLAKSRLSLPSTWFGEEAIALIISLSHKLQRVSECGRQVLFLKIINAYYWVFILVSGLTVKWPGDPYSNQWSQESKYNLWDLRPVAYDKPPLWMTFLQPFSNWTAPNLGISPLKHLIYHSVSVNETTLRFSESVSTLQNVEVRLLHIILQTSEGIHQVYFESEGAIPRQIPNNLLLLLLCLSLS